MNDVSSKREACKTGIIAIALGGIIAIICVLHTLYLLLFVKVFDFFFFTGFDENKCTWWGVLNFYDSDMHSETLGGALSMKTATKKIEAIDLHSSTLNTVLKKEHNA